MKKKTTIKYVAAKKKLDAMTMPDHPSLELAKQAVPASGLGSQEKWYCFAKHEGSDGKLKYTVISYYDIVSPLGIVEESMRWFDAQSYRDNEEAKNRFKSLKV